LGGDEWEDSDEAGEKSGEVHIGGLVRFDGMWVVFLRVGL
jgi:hypothetical protein